MKVGSACSWTWKYLEFGELKADSVIIDQFEQAFFGDQWALKSRQAVTVRQHALKRVNVVLHHLPLVIN